jgi:hypothetical protein
MTLQTTPAVAAIAAGADFIRDALCCRKEEQAAADHYQRAAMLPPYDTSLAEMFPHSAPLGQ